MENLINFFKLNEDQFLSWMKNSIDFLSPIENSIDFLNQMKNSINFWIKMKNFIDFWIKKEIWSIFWNNWFLIKYVIFDDFLEVIFCLNLEHAIDGRMESLFVSLEKKVQQMMTLSKNLSVKTIQMVLLKKLLLMKMNQTLTYTMSLMLLEMMRMALTVWHWNKRDYWIFPCSAENCSWWDNKHRWGNNDDDDYNEAVRVVVQEEEKNYVLSLIKLPLKCGRGST